MIPAAHLFGLSHPHNFPKFSLKNSIRNCDRTNLEEKINKIQSELLQPNRLPVEYSGHHLDFDLQQKQEKIEFRAGFRNNSTLSLSTDTLNQNSFGRRGSSDCGAYVTDTFKREQELFPNSQNSSLVNQPFVFLENAKRLLNSQRIQDARDTLQRGAELHPKDKKIAHLLHAISPGRVTQVKGTAPDRSREAAWIRRHGDKYRGQWVAVNGDDLVATATSLNTLLEKLKQRNGKGNSPLVHYFVPD